MNLASIEATLEPLWVPSVGLDAGTYDDVYAHSRVGRYPLRVALSDAVKSGPAARTWAGLLAEGFVADGEYTAADVLRDLPVRAAVFAAQFSVRETEGAARASAGLLGATLDASGECRVVAAGAFRVARIDRKGRVAVYASRSDREIGVLDEVAPGDFDEWSFECAPGDTLLFCGRGIPDVLFGDDLSWCRDTHAAFQGRLRKLGFAAGRMRSATAIRLVFSE